MLGFKTLHQQRQEFAYNYLFSLTGVPSHIQIPFILSPYWIYLACNTGFLPGTDIWKYTHTGNTTNHSPIKLPFKKMSLWVEKNMTSVSFKEKNKRKRAKEHPCQGQNLAQFLQEKLTYWHPTTNSPRLQHEPSSLLSSISQDRIHLANSNPIPQEYSYKMQKQRILPLSS